MTSADLSMEVARHRRRRVRERRTGGKRRGWPPLRVRDWRVRTKLGTVLVIPAVAFLVVAGLQAGLSVRQAAALDAFAARVALGVPVTALVHELQFERDWVSGQFAAAMAAPAADRDRDGLAGSAAQPREAVARARAAFDTAVEPLRATPELRTAVAHAEAALDGLTMVRTGMAEGWLREGAVFDGYTRAIEAMLALLPTPLAVEDAQVGGYRELADVKELTAQIRGRMHALISAGSPQPGGSERLADLRAQQRAALDRFRLAATPNQLGRFDDLVRGQAVRATARLEQAATERAGAGASEITPQQWWSAATTELELFREVEVVLLAGVDTQVDRASQDRWRQTVAVSASALLILLVSLLLSIAIGRSMVRALRLLRRQAVDVAQVRLPGLLERLRTVRGTEPLSEPAVATAATGGDEVGEVAEAFTQVHRSAVRLAVEQAEMRRNVNRIFVNLSRRSQVLVERQLEVLDAMEFEEAEPAKLANLFRLDHLATRMRRTNDSLLVLTHSEPARRYDQSTLLASVAQAAIAEIERYQRVREDVAGDLYVVGYLVADLAHLLAELLDNATTFSEQDTTVLLTGQQVDSPAGALVEIIDAGMGMTPDALLEANQLVADPPVIDVATSQRMGLVVVGHLAARHGLRVGLEAVASGTRATVWLPERLLAAPPAPSEPVVPSAADAAPAGRMVPGADGEAVPPSVRRPRRTPARAEDVLGDAQATGILDSVWWSRPDGPPGDGDRAAAAAAEPRPDGTPDRAPDGTDAAVRTSTSGLPIRIPLAQLPTSTGRPPGAEPPVDAGLDPDELGSTLSAFYGGVHRAEAEGAAGDGATTTEIDLIPGGP